MQDKKFNIDLPEGFLLEEGVKTAEGVRFLYLYYNHKIVGSFINRTTKPNDILKRCEEIMKREDRR